MVRQAVTFVGDPSRTVLVTARETDEFSSARGASAFYAAAAVIGCLLCGQGRLVHGLVCCERCRRELAPNPVQLACEALNLKVEDLAELAEVSRRSAARALSGEPLSQRLSAKIAKVVGLDPIVVQVPAPPAAELLMPPEMMVELGADPADFFAEVA